MTVELLAGVRPRDMGLQVLRDSQRPILPTTRDRAIMIPGRNGEWDLGADVEARVFNLDCAFMVRNASELQTKVETLARMLVDYYGKPKSVDLVLSAHPDRTFVVRYAGSLPVDRLAGYGRFTLPLIAYDPWASGRENIYETTIIDSPYVITILSDGDIRTQPVIELTNTGADTIASFTLTNEYQLE